MRKRIIPTGKCWCGCDEDVLLGSFFRPGHDRRAESDVILVEYGSVVEFLAEHGYAHGEKNPKDAAEEYRKKKGK